MKKFLFLLNFIFLCFLGYSQSWDYLVDLSEYTEFTDNEYKSITHTNIYDKYGNKINTILPNQKFNSSEFAYVQDRRNQPFDTFEYMFKYEDGWVSTDNIVLENSEVLPVSIITTNKKRFEKLWIPVWYNKILNGNTKLEDYSTYYKNNKNSLEYNLIFLHSISFKNTLLIIRDTADPYYFSIKKIQKKENTFIIYCEVGNCYKNTISSDLYNESFKNLPDFESNTYATFIIEPNGNRIRMYNGETQQLIIELMQVDYDWINNMIKYIKSDYKNKPSALKVVEENLEHPWSDPVTGVYKDGSKSISTVSKNTTPATNVAVNKTMTAYENLKLRSGEATTTSVLTVMQAGTKVKILELGKAETIDGIDSNWVKVEVQKGAKDRNGKEIKAGTVGWCYGGYLK